jgi:transcriptional regulator with GAF, ATPase, and Fis domain
MHPQPPPRSVGDELAAVNARLSGILLTEQTMETALQLITSLATDTLTGSLGAGVTLMRADGQPGTSAGTEPMVDTLDRLQYELGEGPCLAAWASSTVVRSDDLSAEKRWVTWSQRAAEIGMRSVLSAPMDVGGTAWGAVKVYSTTAGTYDARSEDLLHRFASQAAIFVANVHTAQSTQRIGDELRQTLHRRDVIATARGMVMARKGLDYERAYRQLMALARQARLPLSELAERMVSTSVRPNPIQDQ